MDSKLGNDVREQEVSVVLGRWVDARLGQQTRPRERHQTTKLVSLLPVQHIIVNHHHHHHHHHHHYYSIAEDLLLLTCLHKTRTVMLKQSKTMRQHRNLTLSLCPLSCRIHTNMPHASLPPALCSCNCPNTFRRHLRAHYFQQAFSSPQLPP